MECSLCGSNRYNEIEYGTMGVIENRVVHFNCLLFSTGLQPPSGTNVEFSELVENQRKKFRKMKCCYCHKNGANVCCSKRSCVLSFHYVCGIENNARYQFVEPYRAYCDRHVTQPKTRPARSESCCICLDQIYNKTSVFCAAKMLHAPCCRNGWFHIFCLQKYAQTAGSFFKCPLCNNNDKFKKSMPYWGVYVPDNSPDSSLLQRDMRRARPCSARICHNLGGRDTYTASNRLRRCSLCENAWIHQSCTRSGLVLCENCIAVVREHVMEINREFAPAHSVIDPTANFTFEDNASSAWNSWENSCSNKDASTGLQWTSWIVNNILSHPFIVLRRQCQLYSTSRSYHILPFTLVPIIIQIYKRQGSEAFWKGFCLCLLGRGISWILNKIVFFLKDCFAPYFSWPTYLATKCICACITLEINSTALMNMVDSLKAGRIFNLSWRSTLPPTEIIVPFLFIEIAKDILRWFIKTHLLSPVPPEEYNWITRKYEQTFENQQLQIRSNLITHFITEVLLYPFETILCRLQLQGTPVIIDDLDNGIETVRIKTTYKSDIDCYDKIIKNEGFNGLYKGFGALILQFAVQYTVIKIAKWIF